jgi:glycosyltransferase involved in cell wall biosynthesis
MRILHVVTLVDDNSSYGGPLTVAINQCRELIRRGHDAQIVAGWKGTGSIPSHLEGVPAHLFRVRNVIPGMRFSGLFSLSMMIWLWRYANRFHVAHVHVARDLVPLLAGRVLRRTRVAYTTQTHGMITPDDRAAARVIDGLLTLPVLRHAKARFVLTDAEDEALTQLLGPRPSTIRLPNGIAVHDHKRVPSERPDVLFMARLHPRKRVLDFAHAAHKLIDEGLNVQFSVVGPDDGDLPELQHFIEEHPSMGNQFRYEGSLPHDDAVSRLGAAAIFVLPSVDEPFPMTLLEAIAVGTPAICTVSCGVASDLAADGAALVIEPGSRELTDAVRGLLDDGDRRASMSVTARETARTRYSMQVVGNRLLMTYQQEDKVPT